MASEATHRTRPTLEADLDLSLDGSTCVVTGASRGIGRAVAFELARRNARVAVNYCSSSRAAREVADTILDADGEAFVIEADVGEHDDVEAMAMEVHDTFGEVDVLVNNAGVTQDERFDRMSENSWQEVIDVNLTGVFNCTQAFFDDIKVAEHGRLINISSVIGQRGNYGQANYAASKSGLFGLTRSLARELAPHDSTANCVAPGYTRTSMIEGVRSDIQDRIRKDIPLGRFATAEEIAHTVGFLADPRASYITGEVINVNGGMYG